MEIPLLPVGAYKPLCNNLTVVLSEYVIPDVAGSSLDPHVLNTVGRMTLDGFVTGTDNVQPAILDRAIQILEINFKNG